MTRAMRQLATNAAANYAGQAVAVVVGVLLTPLLVSHLGVALYGVLVLVSAVQNLGGMIDLGVSSSVVKYVAEHRARDETDEISRIISTSLALHLTLGALTLVLTVAGAAWGMPLLHLAPDELPVARAALLVAGATLAFRLPLGMLANLLPGLRQYEWNNAVAIVQTLITAAVTVSAVLAGAGPVVLVAINGVSLMVGLGVRVVLAARHLPGLPVGRRWVTWATLRRITGYSLWLFVLDTATRIFTDADNVVIAAFLPITQVTAYNLGWKPASALAYLSGPLVSVFFPAASELEARQARADLQRLLITGTRLALGLTLAGVLVLLLLGRQALAVWVGPGHEDALPVLLILLPVFLVSATQNPAGVILRGMGRVRALAISVLLEYVVNVALTIILVPRVGVTGAAIGTLIPALVNDGLVIPALACRELGIPYGGFLGQTWIRPLLAALPVLLVLGVPLPALVPASLPAVLLAAAAIALSYAGTFWLLAIHPGERTQVRDALRSLSRQATGRIEGTGA